MRLNLICIINCIANKKLNFELLRFSGFFFKNAQHLVFSKQLLSLCATYNKSTKIKAVEMQFVLVCRDVNKTF